METRKDLLSLALKAGLVIAAVGILWFIIQYVLDVKPVGLAKPILLGLFSFALNITILVIYLKKFRTQIGGYITFSNAFLFCLVALVCATIISTIFTFLFIQFFDPLYMKNIMEAQKNWMEGYLAGKMSDEQIAKSLEKLDEQAANANSVARNIKNMGIGIIIGAVISLIVGAIMQKKPNVFENTGGVI